MQVQNKIISNKVKQNSVARIITSIATWAFAITFIALVIFIIVESVPGFQAYGLNGIFASNDFITSDLVNKQVSVWMPLAVTIIITVGSLAIATPLALKTATFIHFRIKSPSLQKAARITTEILAAVPSVVFGLFAYKSLGSVVATIFGFSIPNTVMTSIVMMSFMLIPTIVTLTLNAYSTIDYSLITNSMSLGNSKTKAIYKIFRKQTRAQIVVAVVIAAGRVIGETMAVSMILSSENYKDVFNQGLLGILESSLRPLGAVISKGMFAENGTSEFRGLLFAFGIIMFAMVMILNCIVIVITNNKNNHKFKKWNKFTNMLGEWIMYIPRQISSWINKLFLPKDIFVNEQNFQKQLSVYIKERNHKNKTINFYNYYKEGWEIIDTILVFSIVAWIILDILIKGLYAVGMPSSTLFQYTKNTTGQAVINTLLLILIILIISLPISLMIAIWLNEYSKDGKIKKIILFFMDSIGATPSIIFGMFGLTLFIEILHISAGGAMGNSLLAGALTMVIVIMPVFTRMNQQALQAIPKEIRQNGWALGNSKWYVIKTLVLPQAYKGIFSSCILTIGRILAETAPLFLTAGLSSSNNIALLNPSQTLTTRIYAQLNGANALESTNIMYESALIALILILVMIIIGYLIVPNWNTIKTSIKEKIMIQKIIWQQNKLGLKLDQYESQIQNKNLFLTKTQAKQLNVKNNQLCIYGYELLTIKVIKTEEMEIKEKDFNLLKVK